MDPQYGPPAPSPACNSVGRRGRRRSIFSALIVLVLLAACGPQIGDLQRGEEGRVARVFAGDTLLLEDGTRVFLAEVDAPSGEAPYAAQSQGEIEALALHREVLLTYGGERRWVGRPREGEEAPREAAIAHVFVKSEGGRWFWLQHELVSRGAAYVRARPNNHARADELLALEHRARTAKRGMWNERAYRPLMVRAAARAALEANANCTRGDAPFRIVEGRVAEAQVFDRRASFRMEGATEPPFSIVLFGESFRAWDGPDLPSLTGAKIRVRGTLGVYRDEPQLCLDHSSQLEIVTD
ncbi:MAG: thermonuclease family protein [Hyphomonadaceae bacterium]|nr:thermonuclease family protein [Hyphomonadaceae bacterium]